MTIIDAVRAAGPVGSRQAGGDRADGREVVTPSGAQFLFDRSLTRIRGAARGGEIETRFRIGLAGKLLRVYSLASCIQLWGAPSEDDLETLRLKAVLVGILEVDAEEPTFWLVLSERPYFPTFEALEDLSDD